MTSQSTILVVDDEQAIVDALRYSLEKAHYRVLVARDGEQALDLAVRGWPDLVVLDLMLPGPEGLVRSAATEAALAGETGRTLLRGDRVDWHVLALPLQREGEPIGALTLAHPLSDVAAVLSDLRARLLLAAGQ